MKLVIVTGMSGAGKTIALKMLEDIGFYCVDNLPIPLVEKFAQLTLSNPGGFKEIALGIDIRSGEELSQLEQILHNWQEGLIPYQILFLDAGDEILIKRYKETRRSHPLAASGRIDQGIRKERGKLEFLKKKANYIIDTSQLLTKELRMELEKIFVENRSYNNLFITILSFGFKYGIPADADLVFDVRFLPNPYYVENLRLQTGEMEAVQNYVMKGGIGAEFLVHLFGLLEFLIPNYVLEGKNQLVIAIGCTGGKHRSVTMSNFIYEHLKTQDDLGLKIEHRDIDKDSRQKR
ncbi:MAG: RNase adapter RapZ [Hungatella sp.]